MTESAPPFATEPVAPRRSLRYGPHPSQVIDYYGPAGGAGRRLTVLHGGYWRERYDRSYLTPAATDLAGRGYAVALAEYRRVGGGGGVPGTFDDVAEVVRTAWDGAPQILLGHSAGGHLALWAARRDPARTTGVLAVAPLADLTYARQTRLSDGAVDELIGPDGDPAPFDPALLPPPPAPVVILHGTEDTDVPVEVSRRYAAARGGVLRELPGAEHFGPLTPGSASYPQLLAALAELTQGGHADGHTR
ncbi:alpha/beta hydrolase [Streptomyces sp. ICBB 8177]|uniref:alpha/beta hydrolase n=1 Tax=Streptomyces sp. ICBB 8177 TaxID=563922 RepID=UPI000D6827B9|nr:alpha/beta hydrolase [Streptomyces sp. ICBB 8177]PWI42496.1 alpha/beta hydrolase [Streptomyces sp. ICBB 8177]